MSSEASEALDELAVKGDELPIRPRQIWLRSFYGFHPEDDGYLGWTDPTHRDRLLGLVADGDLFMIYGAASAETPKDQRNRILGFLQVESRPIRDIDKASAAGLERKRNRGWSDKWTNAMPVVRAWRVDEPVRLEMVAPKTYHPDSGRAIAVWSPPLLADEVGLALKVKVTEVNVFGEIPLPKGPVKHLPLSRAFTPSRPFPGGFGTRTVNYEDGPTRMYLARFEGDGFALLGERPAFGDKSVLLKIGVSNDHRRRLQELNAGFPPAAVGRWIIPTLSEPYEGRAAAEVAESAFKAEAAKKLKSQGGEFFIGTWSAAEIIFAQIPGVSRFGG